MKNLFLTLSNFLSLCFAICLTVGLVACSPSGEVAGISTVETENALLIHVVDDKGKPAANVLARVREARNVDGKPIAEYTTDGQGKIALSDSAVKALDVESIAVEVLDDGVGAFAVIDLDVMTRDTLNLAKFGSMEGCIEGSDAQVQIYGTGRTVRTDKNGCFEIDGLPPFEYEVRVTVMGDSSESVVKDVICEVESEKTAVLDMSKVAPEKNTKIYTAETLVSSWMKTALAARENGKSVMGFIRLDSSNFDFSRAPKKGSGISVVDPANEPLDFAVSYWNDSLNKAVILVPMDPQVDTVKFKWSTEVDASQISVADAWKNIDSEVVLEQNSILMVDFESGMKSNLFKPADEPNWIYGFIGDSASIVTTPVVGNGLEGIEDAGDGRDGHAFHWKSSAPNGQWSFVGLWMCRMEEACNLQALDSVAFYTRGKGVISFVLESTGYPNVEGKALSYDTLSTDKWTRITTKPADFIAADNKYGNMGYNAIINAITDFHVVAYREAEIWLDDIRFYGINMDDLEQKRLRK